MQAGRLRSVPMTLPCTDFKRATPTPARQVPGKWMGNWRDGPPSVHTYSIFSVQILGEKNLNQPAKRETQHKGGFAKAQKAKARAAKAQAMNKARSSSSAAAPPGSPSKRKRPQRIRGHFVAASPPKHKRQVPVTGKRERCPICRCNLVEIQARHTRLCPLLAAARASIRSTHPSAHKNPSCRVPQAHEGMQCDRCKKSLQSDESIMSCPQCEQYDLCCACAGKDPTSQVGHLHPSERASVDSTALIGSPRLLLPLHT